MAANCFEMPAPVPVGRGELEDVAKRLLLLQEAEVELQAVSKDLAARKKQVEAEHMELMWRASSRIVRVIN